MHIDQRIPIRLLQIFGPEDLVIDVFLQDAEIDTVRAGKLRSVNGSYLLPKFFLRGEVFGLRFTRVIGQLAIKTVVTEVGRLFGIGSEILLDVIARDFLERFVLRRGGCVQRCQ